MNGENTMTDKDIVRLESLIDKAEIASAKLIDELQYIKQDMTRSQFAELSGVSESKVQSLFHQKKDKNYALVRHFTHEKAVEMAKNIIKK